MIRNSRAPSMRKEKILYRDQSIHVSRRAFQRSIRLKVKGDGSLHITGGLGLKDQTIVDFLEKSWPWVEKQTLKVNKLKAQFPNPQFRAGEVFLFLGEKKKLGFRASISQRARITIVDDRLWIEVPIVSWPKFDHQRTHPEWIAPIQQFYAAEGRRILTSRVKLFQERMKSKPKSVSFRCQRTRWGSCTTEGNISLNWRLIAAPLSVIDYVVVHELAHLQVPNHSDRFWRLVENFCPNYLEHSTWLRKNQMALDFLLQKARRSEPTD